MTNETATERVVAAFLQLAELAAADDDLQRRGRFLSCRLEIGVDAVPVLVEIDKGRVAAVQRGPFLLKPWDFAVRADAATWMRFLEPMPAPGWHDLLALNKVGRARVEGNLVPFMGNLQYVKDLVALPRQLALVGAKGEASQR